MVCTVILLTFTLAGLSTRAVCVCKVGGVGNQAITICVELVFSPIRDSTPRCTAVSGDCGIDVGVDGSACAEIKRIPLACPGEDHIVARAYSGKLGVPAAKTRRVVACTLSDSPQVEAVCTPGGIAFLG
ncbi:hypothetical protein ES703_98343 [subsurface metagenome]